MTLTAAPAASPAGVPSPPRARRRIWARVLISLGFVLVLLTGAAGVVADPATFTRFIGGVARHLTVDNSLTDDEIRRTALSLRLSAEDIKLLQAPISGFGTTPDGQSIDVVETVKLDELARALKTDTMDAYLKKYPQG